MSELSWHDVGPAGDAPEGHLRRVEAGGRGSLRRSPRRLVDRVRRHLHARGVLARRGRARRRRRRVPVPRVGVRRADGRRADAARPRAAPDLRGARGRRRAPRAARAATGRRGGSPCARRPRDRGGSPRGHGRRAVPRGPVARRRRPHRPRHVGGARAVRLARPPAPRGARVLAARGRGQRLLGLHPLRRRRLGLEGLGDVLERARRDVAPGPDRRGARGAEVDARHGSAAAHADARRSSTRASRHA